METVTINFKNEKTGSEIIIKLFYNKEKQELDLEMQTANPEGESIEELLKKEETHAIYAYHFLDSLQSLT